MARCIGLHLNGWQDHAVRDWDAEDHELRLDPPALVDGGTGSVAVTVPPPRQDEVPSLDQWLASKSQWTGGPQAINSPVGRGKGWGDVGDPRLRLPLRHALARLQNATDPVAHRAVAGSAAALSANAERLVMAVPDLPSFAEAAQGRMLAALKRTRGPRNLLLWRSVAAFLGAMNRRMIPSDRAGFCVRLLIHDAAGFEAQSLVLVETDEHPSYFAPERDGFGRLILQDLGLDRLMRDAEIAYLERAPHLTQRMELTRIPLSGLFCTTGMPEVEILRLDNGTWMENRQPPLVPPLAPFVLDPDPQADLTLLFTPLVGAARSALIAAFAAQIPDLQVADWSDIARGALVAGRLIEKGLPHYFDRLEPIALAVLTNDEPEFVPLMDSGSIPANREYVSPVMKGFRWGAGKSRIEFFVRKGAHEIRTWVAKSAESPTEAKAVELQLRQTPGQSWALLRASSPDWEPLAQNPLHLDWEKLTPDPRSEAEILATLRRPAPGFPHRVVEEADFAFWDGSFGEGLLRMVRMGRGKFYEELSRSARKRLETDETLPTGPKIHPVSTDGELPHLLSTHDVELFDTVLNNLWVEHLKLERGWRRSYDNRAFLALTWAFGRCPRPLQARIVEALEAYEANSYDALHGMKSASKILQQGAGRAVNDPDLLHRLLHVLAVRKAPNSDTRAALSFALTRRDDIAKVLDDRLVIEIARMLQKSFAQRLAEESFKQDFTYGLSALAGLLRYRETSPWALTTERSTDAKVLYDLLERSYSKMPTTTLRERNLRDIVGELMAYLAGTGGDPDVLVRIDQL